MKHAYPVHSIDAAKRYESSVLQDDPERTAAAMENAGRAIGQAILADYREIRPWPAAPQVVVLAGKGLNTGDALIAVEQLAAAVPGLRVDLLNTAPEEDWNPLAGAVLKRLRKAVGDSLQRHQSGDWEAVLSREIDVVIDGLYGLGFRPPLKPGPAALLKAVNASSSIRMRAAVDLPSGVGDGTDPGSFVADFTYIPGVAKEPCFDGSNAEKVGRIRFLEIDPFRGEQLAGEGHQDFLVSPESYKSVNRLRDANSDKRTYKHCLILAGSSHMPGAAIMATRAALQAGAGLVTTLTPASVAGHLASAAPEAMWRPLPMTPEGGLDVETVRIMAHLSQKAHAVLIGPGMLMDRATVFAVCRIIRETPLPLILDASALTQDIVSAVMGRPLTAGPVIITPHRGEYARILGLKEDPGDLEGFISFTRKYRLVSVLKGSPTLVCDGNHVVHAPSGGPVLARGGTGDLLSGILLTLLAQHPDSPLEAALLATTWHGAAADSLARENGAIAVRTTDLLPHFSKSLRG